MLLFAVPAYFLFVLLVSLCFVLLRYGHQDEIMAVDSLNRERAVTAGGSDHSVRLWKIPEESHLIFHGHT